MSCVLCVGVSAMSSSFRAHELHLTKSLCPWDSLGKNTGVGCHFHLQGIFPTQGSNLYLLHCWWILYCCGTGEDCWSPLYKTAKSRVVVDGNRKRGEEEIENWSFTLLCPKSFAGQSKTVDLEEVAQNFMHDLQDLGAWIHVNVWQNPLKCCEVIGLQLIKINEKKKKDLGAWKHWARLTSWVGITEQSTWPLHSFILSTVICWIFTRCQTLFLAQGVEQETDYFSPLTELTR